MPTPFVSYNKQVMNSRAFYTEGEFFRVLVVSSSAAFSSFKSLKNVISVIHSFCHET